jgi:hypothetical protein
VTWGEVKAMLNDCARGHSVRESEEYYTVYYAGKVVPRITRGSHRQRGKNSAEIQIGHIRKMVTHLGSGLVPRATSSFYGDLDHHPW